MKSDRPLAAVCVLSLLMLGGLWATAHATEDTAAHHGLELPGNVAAVLPLPSDFDIGNRREIVGTWYVNFRFDLPWDEVLEFFSTRLAQDGWAIEREELPEESRGARTASWVASGHGVSVSLNLETFGPPEGQNSVGVLQVRPSRD